MQTMPGDCTGSVLVKSMNMKIYMEVYISISDKPVQTDKSQVRFGQYFLYNLDYEVIASSGQPSIDVEDAEKVSSPRQMPKKTISRGEILTQYLYVYCPTSTC